ncbi:nitroreductase [Phenylobacterium sp. SCN 70-31]|uniref:nitroreductase family protein n=1 Tax=Phenylobacterium sp. SCN 70-31 TaxID=1660129 RepID=UPI00086ADA49|nr:nitroreductase [Phenylobacterium sp. SCN 70-31]ODT85715.1 MAG: nitroreductase [Phenylobacterium sp. SCN 70-31]
MTSPVPPAPEFGASLAIAPRPDVLDFLALRRSAPALTLAEPGPTAAQLSDLLRIAARVPDHGKLAPWRFVVLEGDAKDAFAARLEAIAQARGDAVLAAKLGKLKAPPLAVAVISSPKPGAIPEWEQVLSAGAVCAHLLQAALAMGFGANWITDWYSYDAEAVSVLGLAEGERIAGFVMIGAAREAPLERERPLAATLVTRWTP